MTVVAVSFIFGLEHTTHSVQIETPNGKQHMLFNSAFTAHFGHFIKSVCDSSSNGSNKIIFIDPKSGRALIPFV